MGLAREMPRRSISNASPPAQTKTGQRLAGYGPFKRLVADLLFVGGIAILAWHLNEVQQCNAFLLYCGLTGPMIQQRVQWHSTAARRYSSSTGTRTGRYGGSTVGLMGKKKKMEKKPTWFVPAGISSAVVCVTAPPPLADLLLASRRVVGGWHRR